MIKRKKKTTKKKSTKKITKKKITKKKRNPRGEETISPYYLEEIPFFELGFVNSLGPSLYGVTASQSDPDRLFASSFRRAPRNTITYDCSTNSGKQCGGLKPGEPCKHLKALMDAAIYKYGLDKVEVYLDLEPDKIKHFGDVWKFATPNPTPSSAHAEIFAKFNRYLEPLYRDSSTEAFPEMGFYSGPQARKSRSPTTSGQSKLGLLIRRAGSLLRK